MKTSKTNVVVEQQNAGKSDINIARGSNEIILPVGMSYKSAHEWLTRKEEAEEQIIVVNDHIICYPLDGLVALKRAAEELYGFFEIGSRGFWGNLNPATMVPVEVWGGDKISIAYEKLTIPTWDNGVIQPIIQPEMKLSLRASVKKKFESEVKRLFDAVKQQIKDNSIYKGKAISVKLDFLTGDEEFHPVDSAPRFMNDVVDTKESDIILNDVTQFEVATNLYSLIERTGAMKKNGISLKHGCLLASTYGTGKTLLGKILAGKAVRNGWTFIYLEKVSQIATAFKFAETYAPAIIFAEDVDQVTSGQRNSQLNSILNTIDGIDTKSKPIITILTTNNVEAIEPAFLRAGRVDSLIVIEKPDEFAAAKFVKHYAGDALSPDVELSEVGKELANMTPAFITEAVQKAKRHAIYRTGEDDITGQVGTNDLLLAAKAMSKHIKLAEQRTEKSPEEQVAQALRIVGAAQSPIKTGGNNRFQNGEYKEVLTESLAVIRQG